ncbi:MAG: low molecular weight protein arginine phosphatase [Paenibacillaceae bacterium]|uniref:low molecular weight protein arginine phosphatase n=1 Tax=Paenibacillus cymbidii TaxID=1639034 RepID=UPI001081FDB1|nr:low molecular weight protein arginine phosphatase [Paenibacillus cymbidii]MBO9604792.1 low molecular weight protein arginine phosphatase [Paenibacillaceae bacterium]
MKASILFVCTGNTCRSPMAEGMLRAMAKRSGIALDVRSAGVAASNGAPASRHTVDILRRKGVSDAFASTTLSTTDIERATLILTMTMSHKRAVIQRYPQAVDKTFTLKEYVEDRPHMLDNIREREELSTELEIKRALGQPITEQERTKLRQLERGAPDHDIADPYGGTAADYEAVAAEIEASLAKLLKRLGG